MSKYRRKYLKATGTEERRTKCVSVRLAASELTKLDKQRGKVQRGTFIRQLWQQQGTMQTIPSINLKAYAELARAAANLAQIAKDREYGRTTDVKQVREALQAFRLALIGAGGADDEG